MNAATNKLILIIFGTILLPIVLYTIYEISTVTDGEEMIEKVYTDQLDAIIFSVNQFSNDNLSGILDKIEDQLTDSLTLNKTEAFLAYSNFHVLMFQHIENDQAGVFLINSDLQTIRDWATLQDSLVTAHPTMSEQLQRYNDGGYRKIEPKETLLINGEKYQVIHAVIENQSGEIFFTGLLSIRGFSNNVLAPRLQQIAQGDLIITLGYSDTEEFVYLTDSLNKEVMFKKNMWIMPGVEVGISSSNKTVKELVEERLYYNLGATVILILLLIFGFGLVVRNFHKEMKLAQTKSDFVSNVSHELRTPLSLISMFAETLFLDRVPSDEKRKEYEEIILKETTRLTNIVNKILNFSQIENNRRVYKPEDVQINDVINELVHDYAYHMEKNGFSYETNLEADLPVIPMDKEALYEALVNLVDNAMKYSEVDKSILFRTGRKMGAVFLEVQDKGVGIAADKLKQIFDKFYRITEGNLQKTRGAGLGLALVSHIVDAHGGDIEVESTPGKGSIFRLVFYLETHGKNTRS